MSMKSLKKQKNTLESMIKKFRSIISDGQFVNISELEERIDHLFNEIEKQNNNLSDSHRSKLTTYVQIISNDLNLLEKELASQHRNLFGKNDLPRNKAIAAYQN